METEKENSLETLEQNLDSESLNLQSSEHLPLIEITKAEYLLQNFNPEHPNYKNPNFFNQIWIYLTLLSESVLPVLQLLTTSFYALLGFYLLSSLGKPELEASLGLYMSIFNFFCKMIAIAIAEQTGIVASSLFASKQYSKMKKSFLNGLLTTTLAFMTIIFPIYYFSNHLTTFIGVDIKVADTT